jgi:nucleoid DNA-binding protein
MTKNDFAKKLSKKTRGWLDYRDWIKIEKIFRSTTAEELNAGNDVPTWFGTFSRKENVRGTTVFQGQDIPIKNKWSVRCSCAEQFKELLNAGEK